MSDAAGQGSYLEKLRFAQRLIRGARYRNDQKQAIRELGEAVHELVNALLEREEGGVVPPAAHQSDEKATP
jgi:hypothetical protein